MAGKNTAVFGICPTPRKLELAVDSLRNAGFHNTDISVLMRESVGSKDLGNNKTTEAPDGVTLGALTIPGLGNFVAAGAVAAVLAGDGADGLIGGLIGLGMPAYEAKRCEARVVNGGILLSVHCDSSESTRRAKVIMEAEKLDDICSIVNASDDYLKTDNPESGIGTC